MSKRFRDTAIWSKPWFRKLSCVEKAAWGYLCDNCDAVGVWDGDTEAADFLIGEKVDWSALPGKTNGNIRVLPGGKWWLVDFCDFQYGDLREECRPHVTYLALLAKHGLKVEKKGYPKGIHTLLDKEKELEKEKDKDKEKKEYADGVLMTPADYRGLCDKYGAKLVDISVQKVSAQQIKTGKSYKNPKGAILQWGIRAAQEDVKKHGLPVERKPEKLCAKCGRSPPWPASDSGLCIDCERTQTEQARRASAGGDSAGEVARNGLSEGVSQDIRHVKKVGADRPASFGGG